MARVFRSLPSWAEAWCKCNVMRFIHDCLHGSPGDYTSKETRSLPVQTSYWQPIHIVYPTPSNYNTQPIGLLQRSLSLVCLCKKELSGIDPTLLRYEVHKYILTTISMTMLLMLTITKLRMPISSHTSDETNP